MIAGAIGAVNVADLQFEFAGSSKANKAGIRKAVPVEMNVRKTTYNSAEFDFWYFGAFEEGGFAYSLWTEQGEFVVGTVLSFSETDYVTYLDGVTFKDEYEDRDESSHYYISTYWILNSLNGIQQGEDAIWQKCVSEVEKGNISHYALHAGVYYLQVQEYLYDGSGNVQVNKQNAKVKFEIYDNVVSDLKATVAADKKTATISWVKPSLPAGAHLYMSVQSGSEVVYDNAKVNTSPENPLTVEVTEGRTYSVSAQYVNGKKEPLGSMVKMYFTVGTNAYTISNLKAVVTKDDYVDFTWSASKAAPYYMVNVYKAGSKYATYTVTENKLTKQIETGTYTWDVAAYEKAEDNLYYPMTEFVKGNEFTTKSAPLPEGTIEMNVWAMEAFYMESEYKEGGKYPWLITFETGTANGNGLPEVWIVVWADKELKLSGNYSNALQNVEISATAGDGCLLNTTNAKEGLVTATSVELKLEFEGYELEYTQMGYFIPYYSGEFKMSCADGKKYYGKINQLMCGAYPYSQLTVAQSSRTIISMLGEAEQQGVEEVLTNKGVNLNEPMFNILGQPVDAGYKGVVIQNGRKFIVD